jgi:hypothetical protein
MAPGIGPPGPTTLPLRLARPGPTTTVDVVDPGTRRKVTPLRSTVVVVAWSGGTDLGVGKFRLVTPPHPAAATVATATATTAKTAPNRCDFLFFGANPSCESGFAPKVTKKRLNELTWT